MFDKDQYESGLLTGLDNQTMRGMSINGLLATAERHDLLGTAHDQGVAEAARVLACSKGWEGKA